MSTTPPPVAYPQSGPPPQSTTNVWAIVSLITGILGCLFITPIVAIVTGIVGISQAKPPRGGKGMAIAGIILGILWIVVGIGGIIAARAGIQWVQTAVTDAAKQPTINLLNAVQQGDFEQAGDDALISDSKLRALSTQLQGLGTCTDLTIEKPHYSNNNGVVTFGFSGTAVFENGTRNIQVEVRQSGEGVVIEKLELE